MVTEFMDMGNLLPMQNETVQLKKMPEVLKFSTSKNTFKSYTVGKKKWTKWYQKFRLTVFPVGEPELSDAIHF